VIPALPTSRTSDSRLSAAATPRELPLRIASHSLTWATSVSLACTCDKQGRDDRGAFLIWLATPLPPTHLPQLALAPQPDPWCVLQASAL
jgi:hypothetical protein